MEIPPVITTAKACPFCGEVILSVARKCKFCQEYLDPAARPKAECPSGFDLIATPVGRDPVAILAGYLGLFAVLPLVGVITLIVSNVALRRLKKYPEALGRGRAIFGLIMGILTTLVNAAVLVTIVITSIHGPQWK